jgi:putative hydrolase of the HAD superfamily
VFGTVANHTLPSPVWLFDLDNTLHDASHAIFPAISANMNTYIGRVLGDGLTPATQAQVDAARLGYWKRYGATLLGMIRHHGVSAADFLHVTHDLGALDKLVRAEKGLGTLLRRLPGRKILLTNAPTRYSTDVMRHLGLSRHFAHHVAIEHMHVHRQLRPKPSSLMLRRLLRKHGGHAGQPEKRQPPRPAHRLGDAVPAHERSDRKSAAAKDPETPRLRRCQSKIRAAASGASAPAALIPTTTRN